MSAREGVGEFEQLVMLVVVRLGSEAVAPEIARVLEETARRGVSRGALYSTLNRLEQKGLLQWQPEEPSESRGGQARRLFEVTPEGLVALRLRRRTLLSLWDGIEATIDGGER